MEIYIIYNWTVRQNNLIGSDPKTAPLQLRAAIALSACESKITALNLVA